MTKTPLLQAVPVDLCISCHGYGGKIRMYWRKISPPRTRGSEASRPFALAPSVVSCCRQDPMQLWIVSSGIWCPDKKISQRVQWNSNMATPKRCFRMVIQDAPVPSQGRHAATLGCSSRWCLCTFVWPRGQVGNIWTDPNLSEKPWFIMI